MSMVGPSETRKSQPIDNWLKNGTFIQNWTKFTFFHQHCHTLYDVMQKEIENLEIDQGVVFDSIDSLKKVVQNTC